MKPYLLRICGSRSPGRAVRGGRGAEEPSITRVEAAGRKEEQGRAEKVAKAPGERGAASREGGLQ